jgi:hypothetical protein
MVTLDHLDARAYDPRQLERGHAGGKRVARERRAQLV